MMISLVLDRIRWRTTRARVQKRATALIHAHGDVAFFRAHDAAWIARGLNAREEATFWDAVAREIARQIQRGAMIAAIMQASGTERTRPRGAAIGAATPRPQTPRPAHGTCAPAGSTPRDIRLV